MTRLFFALILICLATTASAGTDGNVVDVSIKDFKFNPQTVTVKVGTTVRWLNEEKRQYHSVWFEEAGDPEADYFFPEESTERTFDKPGTYHYRCGPHEEMTGVIIVE